MRIAMLSGEANPLIKTGGLADVIYSLSKELVQMDQEVVVTLPYYASIKAKKHDVKYVCSFDVAMGWRHQNANIYEKNIDGIRYLLIENDAYFGRPSLYGYDDDYERFAFYTMASLRLFQEIGFKPDIVHVHDWQPGLAPAIIKEGHDPFYEGTRCVLTIHNPAFKGYFNSYFVSNLYGLSNDLYESGKLRFENQASSLKSAIVYCDKITTVSPTHAKELLTPELSQGLSGVLELRRDDFVGIVNGNDSGEFDPSTDKWIAKNYTTTSVLSGKKMCRADLLKTLGLKDNGGPIYGFVTRLTYQKGIDLILKEAPYMISQGAIIVALGSGEYELEQGLERLRAQYPEQVGIYIGYNNERAHKIYAGSDFFLMPSLFEPCGIGQMIALAYGTIPVVRETGGLVDTVVSYKGDNDSIADGVSFRDYDQGGIGYAAYKTREIYANPSLFQKMRKNAMKADHSWKKSAIEYLNVYKGALDK